MDKIKRFFMHFGGVLKHKIWVSKYIISFILRLLVRMIFHDVSKMRPKEICGFMKIIGDLQGLEYGSDEYNENLKKLNGALRAHYEKNKHHPEHFKDGVYDMELLDLVEMICDWKAASRRCKNSDVKENVNINKDRFKLEGQLTCVIRNSL